MILFDIFAKREHEKKSLLQNASRTYNSSTLGVELAQHKEAKPFIFLDVSLEYFTTFI